MCPYADIPAFKEPHTRATLADIQTRLRNDMELRSDYASLSSEIFSQTEAYLVAIRKMGCTRPLVEPTLFTPEELEGRKDWDMYWSRVRRGGKKRQVTCQGRIIFERNSQNQVIVRLVCSGALDLLSAETSFIDVSITRRQARITSTIFLGDRQVNMTCAILKLCLMAMRRRLSLLKMLPQTPDMAPER